MKSRRYVHAHSFLVKNKGNKGKINDQPTYVQVFSGKMW